MPGSATDAPSQASDTQERVPTAAVTAPSEAPPAISERLASRMNPRQLEALRSAKGEKEKEKKSGEGADAGQAGSLTPAVGQDAQPPVGAAKAAAKAAAPGGENAGLTADGENVIDLGGSETTEGEGGNPGDETNADQPPNVEGLDDAAKERVIKLHKEQAKLRKRAQEAEKERDALKGERDTLKVQLDEAGNYRAGASSNMFVQAGFTDVRDVQSWADDAQKRINLILDKSKESKVHKMPNGDEVDLAEDEAQSLIDAQQTIAAALQWKEQRTERAQSDEKSKVLAKKFEKVPEFSGHLAEIEKLDPVVHLPLLQKRASIGALVESGKYILVKRGTNLPAKAAAASSAASTVPGAQDGTAGTTAKAAPPAEVARAVPAASRAGDESGPVVIPSELTERAMRGDQEAVKEIIRLKARGKKKAA